jgi:hypothetical protein
MGESSTNNALHFDIDLIMNEVTRLSLRKAWGSVKIVSLFSDADFEQLISNLSSKKIMKSVEFDYREVGRNEDLILFSCAVFRRSKTMSINGSFYVLQKKPFLFFVTGQRNVFFSRVLLPLSRAMFPIAIRSYVTSEDLFQLLDQFSKETGVELRYTESVSRKMFGKAFSDRRHEKRIDPTKYELFTVAFKRSREQEGRVDRIRVFGNGYDFSISRSGIVKIYRGDFVSFYRYFALEFVERAISRWKVFESRSRTEQPQKEVRPLLLKFDSNVFDDVSVRKELVNIISSYSNSEYSVIHEGNPYVYIAVLDRLDNSSFTIRTYDSDSLIVIPQIRTTKTALVRFSKHLLDRFHEGVMTDFETEAV